MAATAITLQSIALDSDGVTVTKNAVTASDGDKFLNSNGRSFCIIENGSGSSINAVVSANQTVSGAALTVPDLTVAVANGAAVLIGPFPTATFNDSNNYVTVTCSDDTSVTIAALEY